MQWTKRLQRREEEGDEGSGRVLEAEWLAAGHSLQSWFLRGFKVTHVVISPCGPGAASVGWRAAPSAVPSDGRRPLSTTRSHPRPAGGRHSVVAGCPLRERAKISKQKPHFSYNLARWVHTAVWGVSSCSAGWEEAGTTDLLGAGYDSHGEVPGLYSRGMRALKWYLCGCGYLCNCCVWWQDESNFNAYMFIECFLHTRHCP